MTGTPGVKLIQERAGSRGAVATEGRGVAHHGAAEPGTAGKVVLTIGEMAKHAHVPTSTIRFYERRGLLEPDTRQSGRRRYRTETLRLLVFIGMLQDAGLALDDIDGILNAATVAEWKAIAGNRLEILDERITKLQHARELLALALMCRFDHPATDCQIMGAEIDRRLND